MKSTTAKVLAIIFLLALTAAQLRAGTGDSTNSETDSYNVNLKADLFNNTSALAGISLTIMVLLLVAIALYARHHREKMLHETLRTMIEKGIPVNSEIVAQLGRRGRGNGSAKSRSRHLLPGLILTGAGIVLVIDLPWHFVGGWIVLVIGLAFLIVWLSERKQNDDQQPPKP